MNTLGGTVGKSDLSRVNLLPASRLSHQHPAASVWICYDPCSILRTLHVACVGSAATIISRECCSVEAKLQVCRSCCVPRCMLGSPGDFGERRNCCMASLQPAAHTGPRVSCSLSQLTAGSIHDERVQIQNNPIPFTLTQFVKKL